MVKMIKENQEKYFQVCSLILYHTMERGSLLTPDWLTATMKLFRYISYL